jgi:hypothetical protein
MVAGGVLLMRMQCGHMACAMTLLVTGCTGALEMCTMQVSMSAQQVVTKQSD